MSQHNETQLHETIHNSTDWLIDWKCYLIWVAHLVKYYFRWPSHSNFTICTVLNWLTSMQLSIQVKENSATAYPTVQLCITTFRQGKAIQNDVLTTAYHDVVSDQGRCDNLVPVPIPRSYYFHSRHLSWNTLVPWPLWQSMHPPKANYDQISSV